MKNVSFLIPDCFSVNLDINGIGFNISHGDDVRGQWERPTMACNVANGTCLHWPT